MNGTCDFQFSLWNAVSGGAQVGTTQTKTNVAVSNGYFTIPDLDFGAGGFQGDARWLAVAVRCPAGSGTYTTLSPRQALTAAPYALGLRPGAVINDTNSNLELNRYVAGTISMKYGVYAKAQGASINVGVYGEAGNDIDDVGVAGYSPKGWGVYGESGHASGYGVFGYNNSGTGVYGKTIASQGYGVYGENNNGTAVYAVGKNAVVGMSSTPDYAAVYGRNTASTGAGYGVYGRSDSNIGTGVYGTAAAYGVYGVASGEGGRGVLGQATATTGSAVGVFGVSQAPLGYAGYFSGKVRVTGVLEKAGGGFKIDHPLDPANQYLNHSFVESPDMKNVYDGVVTLDANGEAVVKLPAWFEALNRDFRYQLTCIGGYAPVYIAAEIHDNR